MTIFKWLHLAFSFGNCCKKTISPTARTIHPSLPHPQRLPGTFESGRRVEVLLHTQVSDLRHTSIKEVSAPFLQNPDGRPQGRDGDAGSRLQGQQEGYLLKKDDNYNDKKKTGSTSPTRRSYRPFSTGPSAVVLGSGCWSLTTFSSRNQR